MPCVEITVVVVVSNKDTSWSPPRKKRCEEADLDLGVPNLKVLCAQRRYSSGIGEVAINAEATATQGAPLTLGSRDFESRLV